jgi:hypothetical protein
MNWSGSRSKSVAETLGGWLEQVIQAVEPWISSGISKGARWQAEVVDKLEEAKVGIVCLTSSNLAAPWILFEAGALSKTKGSYVCTSLLDIAPADIEPPLGQFQHTIFNKDDVRQLVETINKAIHANGERSLNEQAFAAVFEKFWPDLESQLLAISKEHEEKPNLRPDRALLEEVLELQRSQERRREEAEIKGKQAGEQIAKLFEQALKMSAQIGGLEAKQARAGGPVLRDAGEAEKQRGAI